jgi:choice-of-anchor B domain-containing protein
MPISPRATCKPLLGLILATQLLAASTLHAHDVEPEGLPEDVPGEAHFDCEEDLAGSFPCRNISLVEFVPLTEFGGGRTNDIWGWTDPLTGIDYAIVGVTNGTAFFELGPHGHPSYLGRLPTRTVSSTWRDMKVYGNYVFIVSEASAHGMQVFDLTRLRGEPGPPETFTSDAVYTRFGRSHNIAINEDSGYAYAVGTNTCGGGLHMIDISEPLSPRFAGCFSADGYTHDAQCVIYHGPDLEFVGSEICINSNEDTVTVVDVSDKSAPVMLSRKPYFSSRYTHQGWLTEEHDYFFLDDELDERDFGIETRTFVWDVSDLRAPRITGVHRSDSTAIDHNQYVVGNHVFQANYRSGIRILRIGDLSIGELVEVAYFDTSPADDKPQFSGTWSVYPYFESGVIVASDINKGLFVLRPDLTAVPECSDTIDNDGDGLRDYPEDPTCPTPDHASESVRLDVEFDFGAGWTEERIESSSHGMIHLALLGSETVDVDDIELSSLRLGPDAAVPAGPNENAWTTGQTSFSDDPFEDRVIKFRMNEIGVSTHEDEICLEGLIGGESFVSCYSLGEEHDEEGHHDEGLAPGQSSSESVLVPALGLEGTAALAIQLILGGGWALRDARPRVKRTPSPR